MEANESLRELPSGWELTKLEHVSEKINPGFPSGKHNKENRGVPHIRPMNISIKGEIDLSNVKYVEVENYEPLLNGDVLFNNTNSPEMLGKTTFLKQDTNWAYSNHMTRIRLIPKSVESAWIAYYLHSLFLKGFFKINCVHHVNQASINSGFLSKKVLIPLAPLPEQHRIVARIEELLSHLDAGVQALQQAKSQLQRYRQALLKAAVEGRLTEVWRKAHPEVELIEPTIKSGKKSAERLDLSTYMLPNLPATWKWIALHMIADAIDPQPSHRTPPEVDEGVPYIGIGDVDEDGSLNFNLARKVSKEILIEHRERYQLNVGDFIFGKIGTLGRPARLTKPFNYTLSANVILIKPNLSYINQKFLFSFMESPLMDNLLRKDSRATTQAAFGIKKVRMLPIPLPPQKEQNIIVDRLDQLISVSDEMRDIIEQEINRADHLRQSILKRAFEGKLVPQDPSDEPTSVLLERIRAERTKETPQRGRKSNNSAHQMRLAQ